MAKEYTKGFYTHKAWRQCRAAFISDRIAIDGGRCQLCHEAQGYIVHHKQELDQQNIMDADVALNHSNLMYLCQDCHNKVHGKTRPSVIMPDGRTVTSPYPDPRSGVGDTGRPRYE